MKNTFRYSIFLLSALALGCGDLDDEDTDSVDQDGTLTSESDTFTDAADPDDPYDTVRQACVDKINDLRATIGMAPLQRWRDAEACADGQAQSDRLSGVPHGASWACNEQAQSECPGWPSVNSTITSCLDMMWAEGPGEPYIEHGHYLNMTNPSFKRVACGFSEGVNDVWALQNFQ